MPSAWQACKSCTLPLFAVPRKRWSGLDGKYHATTVHLKLLGLRRVDEQAGYVYRMVRSMNFGAARLAKKRLRSIFRYVDIAPQCILLCNQRLRYESFQEDVGESKDGLVYYIRRWLFSNSEREFALYSARVESHSLLRSLCYLR